ncbi:hypothetical protein B0H16DRAFT_1715495 [Mycena metata]|uniref:Uncharacterized protein n=1 Tax=Mycena metata TaxID=1033252 RepID=A0AAD7NPA3_9AGAR|nr:hypothetical protein B0H16DRAFT_1715495 [Mycena metata]
MNEEEELTDCRLPPSIDAIILAVEAPFTHLWRLSKFQYCKGGQGCLPTCWSPAEEGGLAWHDSSSLLLAMWTALESIAPRSECLYSSSVKGKIVTMGP